MNMVRPLLLSSLLSFASVLLGCGPEKVPADAPIERTATPGPQDSAVWPTYHGDAGLAGVSSAPLPDNLEMRWRYRADEKILNPPVSDGKRWYVVTFHGRAVALDLVEGKKMWETQLWAGTGPDGKPQKATVDSPPACFGNSVYIATARGIVHALDTTNGAERWQVDSGGTFMGTVNYGTLPGTDGKQAVYAMSQDDGTVYSIDPDSGEVLWDAVGPERCDGSPAVHEDMIIFGSCAAALHIVSAGDGAHVRDIPIDEDSQIAAGVAIAEGEVFAGCRSGKLIHADLATGVIKWVNEDSGDEIFTTPAVKGDAVVFASRDGAVYCLDRKTGKQQWKFPTEGEPLSPVIADDKVAFSSDGTLYLLRLSDGEQVWSRKVSDDISSPAVLNDVLVVAGEDGAVTAFGPPQAAGE